MNICQDPSELTDKEFQTKLRGIFPDLTIAFATDVEEFKKAIGPKPTLLSGALKFFANGSHQFAVRTGKKEIVFVYTSDSFNAFGATIAENVFEFPARVKGNVPPIQPPCSGPPRCLPDGAELVTNVMNRFSAIAR